MNVYEQSNPKYFAELQQLVENSTKWALQVNAVGRKRDLANGFVPKYKHLKDWINEIVPMLKDPNYTIMTKVYWILNGIKNWNHHLVKCKTCGKTFEGKNVINTYVGYHGFCSTKCSSINPLTQEKVNRTNLKRFGKHPSAVKELQEKARQTRLERYGDENFNNNAKAKETRLKHFNKYAPSDFRDKCIATKLKNGHTWNWNNSEQRVKTRFNNNGGVYDSEETIKKKKQTCLERYGVEHSFQSKEMREKSKKTCLEKYGCEYSFQAKELQEKSKETSLKLYGTEYPSQSKVFREKFKKTCLEKFGCESPTQNREVRIKGQQRYEFNGIKFDSSPELAYYIWLSDNKIKFEYQPDKAFEYEFDGKKHVCLTDFLVDGQYIELKGSQFVKKDGTWQNPYDHSLDEISEAKRQCLIKNNVRIMYSNEYSTYLDYVSEKYGKEYLMSFKKQAQTI